MLFRESWKGGCGVDGDVLSGESGEGWVCGQERVVGGCGGVGHVVRRVVGGGVVRRVAGGVWSGEW